MSKDVIKMPKRFDYSSGAEFNQAIVTAIESHPLVTLDFEGLEYIDSAGIGLLVMANKKAQGKNAKLVIIHLRAGPKEILQLANLQKLIDIR